MIFRQPGRLLICDWKDEGPKIVARYEELARRSDPKAERAMRLIQDRYGRLVFKGERRASLGTPALAHLGLERGVVSKVYIAALPNWLELLSVTYRNGALVNFDEELEDLPFFSF